ncbi:hypothetical protein FA13DRAFT_1572657, partial [Coprinellus micaceus]
LLNLALTVSHLSQAFYNQSMCAYDTHAFRNRGYPEWVRNRYEQIKQHEDDHTWYLYNVITSAGGNAIRECEYNPEVNNADDFVELSEAIETLSASAFNAIVRYLQNDKYRTVVASILGTQSRHAAWINSAVRMQNPWNTAFETPISLDMIFNLVGDFIVDGSCPISNNIATMLPQGLVDFGSLELPERIKAGHKVQIQFDNSNSYSDSNNLYAAFLVGSATYYEPVWQEDGCFFVKVPRELKAKGAVYIVILQNNGNDFGNIIAGPALIMFPFNSEGEPVAEG